MLFLSSSSPSHSILYGPSMYFWIVHYFLCECLPGVSYLYMTTVVHILPTSQDYKTFRFNVLPVIYMYLYM